MWYVYQSSLVKPYIPAYKRVLGGSDFFFLQFVFSHGCCNYKNHFNLSSSAVPGLKVPLLYRAKRILKIGLLALFFCVWFCQNISRRSYAEIVFAHA